MRLHGAAGRRASPARAPHTSLPGAPSAAGTGSGPGALQARRAGRVPLLEARAPRQRGLFRFQHSGGIRRPRGRPAGHCYTRRVSAPASQTGSCHPDPARRQEPGSRAVGPRHRVQRLPSTVRRVPEGPVPGAHAKASPNPRLPCALPAEPLLTQPGRPEGQVSLPA